MIKKIQIAAVSLLLVTLTLSSCGKANRKGKINRDCTGTYLELNNKDYLICNPSMTDSYADGSSVRVDFNSINDCDNDPNIAVCELYHKHYGLVEITEIK